MSESKRVKVSSVAAFMLLPQFHLSFRGFAHIVPVFVRTVAIVFVAAGLIPNNHPATRYGVEGVKKYSFVELLGEAWFNLRRTQASTHQWGLFAAVVMMLVAIVSAFGAFILTVFFNLGAIAHAQIYSYPTDVNTVSPYGATDQTNLTALQGLPAAPANVLFDMRTDPGQASQDYALMVLDKVLRQSAIGTGGAMQNALAGMMQIYNTGIMVVAAVMIFWMILSIVVDTAKTGIVGGGRHNMVWTPIRVVFALGIMIPLGTTGFSSGQFAVMKLAEWGSNFGSRLWAVYTNGVINNVNLLTAYTPGDVGPVVVGIAKTMTCQVAYNASARQVMGWAQNWLPTWFTGAQAPLVGPRPSYDPKSQQTTNFYTNGSDGNLCGGVTFTGIGSLLSFSEDTDSPVDAAVSGASGGTTVACPSGTCQGNPLLGTGLSNALLQYRTAFETGVAQLVDESGTPADNPATSGGAILTQLRRFACAVAETIFTEDSGGANAAAEIEPCNTLGTASCGNNGSGMPDHSCITGAATTLKTALQNTHNAAVVPLNTWVQSDLGVQMSNRGWGGMGTWFMYINALNQAIMAAQEPKVIVQPGKLWSDEAQPGFLGSLANTVGNYTTVVGITGAVNYNTIPEANKKTFIAMERFDSWWDGMQQDASVNATAAVREQAPEIRRPGFWSGLKALKNALSSPWGMVEYVFGSLMPNNLMLFSIDTTSNEYPLSQMVKMGGSIQTTALWIIGVNTLLGLIPAVNYGSSALGSLMSTVGKMMFLGGTVLSLYLPILPLLRVAFAVLTWITSVFEAVVMVPIAALAHLSSEGEGLAGGARTAWILWLNVLLRPALVVCGFVGAMLIFNAFAVYFNSAFVHGVTLARAQMGVGSFVLSIFTYSVVYVMTLYTTANTTFKMLDLVPDAMMRWIGGSPDRSFDDNSDGGFIMAASLIRQSGGSSAAGNWGGAAWKGGKAVYGKFKGKSGPPTGGG